MLEFLVVVAIGVSPFAESDTVRRVWTLSEYIALVESSSPELAIAHERKLAADARIAPNGRPPDPMVELGIMNRSLPRFDKSSPVAMDQIRISQSLPIPGSLGTRTRAARARAEGEAAQRDEVRYELRWRTATKLLDLARIDQTIALLRTLGPRLETLRTVATARYSVGQAQQSDVLRAQLEETRLEEEIVELLADRQSAVARLNAMALRAPGSPIDSIVVPSQDSLSIDPTKLVERSLLNRPLIVARRAEREAAALDRRGARLARWPAPEVGLAYGQQPMFGTTGTDRMVSMTLGFSLPIWSGSRQRQMVREAEAIQRMAVAEVSMAEVETGARVGELVAAFDRASKLFALYRQTLIPEARAAAQSALASYRVGDVDFETVVSAQLAIVRAEIELVRLANERLGVLTELDYLSAGAIAARVEGAAR